MQQEDRRAAGVQRVPVERIVEICGREPGIPAFEAESVELSGRGMHVRTPYLPEQGAPLVCRLEDDGREVVVEGVVAWRNTTEAGGEFGVRFTALDSRGVDVLKSLCGIGANQQDSDDDDDVEAAGAADPGEQVEATDDGGPDVSEPSPPPPLATPGQPVKLHIDGLGSPMKARVRRGSKRRVHVGSNLEFLKVGRNLQVEDLGNSSRMAAFIDSVDVTIDPQTDVPQLVVTLRYEGVDDVTPSPSVVDAEVAPRPKAPQGDTGPVKVEAAAPPAAKPSVAAVAPRGEPPAEPADDLDDDDDLDDELDRFVQQNVVRERLAEIGTTAQKVMQSTGSVLGRVGRSTAVGAMRFAKQAGERALDKVGDVRKVRAQAQRRRRTSAVPASAATGQRLRPQSGARRTQDTQAPDNARKKKIALVSAGLGVVLVGAVIGFAGGSEGEEKAKAVARTESAEVPVAKASAEVAPPPAMKVAAAEPQRPKGPPTNDQGIIADVPLFGATPMATMEPAPLEPPEDAIEAAEESDVPDETFDEPAAQKDKGSKQAVWGHGRLHLPFVHRIKLDEPGGGIEGAKRPTGFTVFLPGRKLLETGKAIQRRDDRIVEVRTSNEPRGARVTFVFQGDVPAYKVRLKGQNVEFFISSPEGK